MCACLFWLVDAGNFTCTYPKATNPNLSQGRCEPTPAVLELTQQVVHRVQAEVRVARGNGAGLRESAFTD
jgi:hypothetical protein